MTHPHHRNGHPKYRNKYKIHNWRAYERSLINRGDLTLWFSEDVILSWSSNLIQRIGRPKIYSDLAIETALTIRLLFKLPLRQTVGFLNSIFRLINFGLKAHDQYTVSHINSILKLKLKKGRFAERTSWFSPLNTPQAWKKKTSWLAKITFRSESWIDPSFGVAGIRLRIQSWDKCKAPGLTKCSISQLC